MTFFFCDVICSTLVAKGCSAKALNIFGVISLLVFRLYLDCNLGVEKEIFMQGANQLMF